MAGAERLAAGVHGADLGEGEGLTGAASGAGGTGVLRGEGEPERVREKRKNPWNSPLTRSVPTTSTGLASSPPSPPPPLTEGNCSKRIAAALPLLGLKLLPMRL